ncbi:MAG: primosomal protein N', partial [Muribaculaceae bacterium]|nr:primosomal protein N' [Muribaculaceae bacterium]
TIAARLERRRLTVSEKLVVRYRTHTETMVALPEQAADPAWRAEAFAAVKGARKQENLLLSAMQMLAAEPEVTKSRLMDFSGCSSAIVKILADKGLIRIYKKEINRFRHEPGASVAPLPELSAAQSAAMNSIIDQWSGGLSTVLLRGVTSSGKTEIYITLIDRMLRQGHQVLYLVPEIALTTQLTTRLQRVFGSDVVVYHSKFTDNERVDIWRRLLSEQGPCVVIGARSSVFLPFGRLGMVIVDEEHEQSYKQFDPAPRYNARDSAMVLASMHGAKVLLGSATPSVESYAKACDGKYGLAELTERYGGVTLPEVEVVDMQREFKRQGGIHSLIADASADAVKSALANDRQAIIFHNRRGFAPMARCKQCAHVAKCNDCDVSLTYHRSENRLVCHYCGASYPLLSTCPVCKEPAVEIVGYGTERVEERVQQTFPEARILRMDLD